MKVIDLLNGIANYGEYKQEFHFKYYDRNAEEYDISLLLCETLIHKLETGQIDLNDEVEIIEEDKGIENNFQHVYNSDNDLIDRNFENIRTTLENIIKAITEMREDK